MRSRGDPSRAKARPSSRTMHVLHRLLLIFWGTGAPTPHQSSHSCTVFFPNKSSTQRGTHPGSGFWRKEGCNGHTVPQWHKKKMLPNTRASVGHHLFDQGPAVPQRSTCLCQVPGQSSQSTCSNGGTGFLSMRHPYLQGAGQGTQTRPQQGTPRPSTPPPHPLSSSPAS